MNERKNRKSARRSPETAIMDAVRELAEPLAPTTIQDWFIDGLGLLDIWIDVPAGTEEAKLVTLLESLRLRLIEEFSELRPPYGCSLVLTCAEQGFGSVHLSKESPTKAKLLLNSANP
jgi:hypothetical protein